MGDGQNQRAATSTKEGNMVHPKVAAAGAAGAVTVIVVYVASLFGLDVPQEVAGALTVLLSFAAGYLTPSTE